MSYRFWFPFPSPYELSKLSCYFSRIRKCSEGQDTSESMGLILVLIFFPFESRNFFYSLIMSSVLLGNFFFFYILSRLFSYFHQGLIQVHLNSTFCDCYLAKIFLPTINHLVNNTCWKCILSAQVSNLSHLCFTQQTLWSVSEAFLCSIHFSLFPVETMKRCLPIPTFFIGLL